MDQLQLHEKLGGIYVRLRAFKVADGLGILCKNITDINETIADLEELIKKTVHEFREPIQ